MSKLGNYYVRWETDKNTTTCTVQKDYEVLAVGKSSRNPKDRPNMRIARRHSFTRAMDAAIIAGTIPKEDVGGVYGDYITKVRQPQLEI